MLAAATGREPHARLHLRKQIPLAAGLAGGSADAAAALVACDALWGTGLSREDLAALAAGSAPTCRSWCSAAPRSAPAGARRSARCSPPATPGTGWSRSPTAACPRPRSTGSSTGCASAGAAPAPGRLDRRDPGRAAPARRRRAGQVARQRPRAGRAVACGPALRATLAAGVAAGALAGVVSGSGPTCAFLCRGRRLGQPGSPSALTGERHLPHGPARRTGPSPAPGWSDRWRTSSAWTG